MPWCITRAVGGPPHAPSEGICPLAPPDPRERGGGAKLGSSHGAFGLAWTRTGSFVSFNSTNMRKVANYRARCRDSPRVRSVGRQPPSEVMCPLAPPGPRVLECVREEPNRTVAASRSVLFG